MNGVEILAVEEVAVAFGFDWSLFIITGVLLSMLFSLIGVLISMNIYEKATADFIAISVFLGFAIGFVLGSNSETGAPTKFETRYKVTISDEVSMVEFFERYEIIEREGKIYTIREVD